MKKSLCAIACVLMIAAASDLRGQYSTKDCDTDRGPVRTGKVDGGSWNPDSPTGTPITLEELVAMKWPTPADPSTYPSKRAPNNRVAGEGTVYILDNVQIGGFAHCESSVYLEIEKVNDFGGYDFGTVGGHIPHADCRPAGLADAIARAYTTYTRDVSVWRSGWDDNFCGESGGEDTGPLRIIGMAFWEDDGGATEPRMSLSPILAIIPLGGDGGSGTGDGSGDAPPPPPPPPVFSLSLPAEFDVDTLLLGNSATRVVPFRTGVDSSFNSDLNISVATDAADYEDFHATVNPSVIAAPGSGEGELTITTGATTFPRTYHVTLTADSGAITYSRTLSVAVDCNPPFILGTDQPKNVTATRGGDFDLAVVASGTGPFTYQWYRGAPGMTRWPVTGATGAKMTTRAFGNESYWVRVSNACGSVDSNVANVTTPTALNFNKR